MRARDGCWLTTAGLVLVRQMPGSAKGVMFITIEDETGIANLIVWPSVFEQQRRVILAASLLAVHGRIQREGEVVHLIAHRLHDLSGLLAGLGTREVACPRAPDHGNERQPGSSTQGPPDLPPQGVKPRTIDRPDLRHGTIQVRAHNFR